MTHKHGFEVLWDEENDRLFAFCTSGGIAECSLEIECDEIERRLNEHTALKNWQSRAVDSLLFWLEGKDDIDFTIHADRLLRDLCNCENELPPCRICYALANTQEIG